MDLRNRCLPLLALLVLSITAIGCETSLDPAPTPDLSAETKRASALLPSEATVMGMMDLQSVRERGPERFREMMSLDRLDAASESAARLRDFLSSSGVDPEKDLKRMYMAVAGENDDREPYLVVYGDFRRQRIEETVRSKFGNELTETQREGTTIFTAADANRSGADKEMSFAVVNDELIVGSSSPDRVAAMLSRQNSEAGTMNEADTPDLMRLAAQGESAWFVVRDVQASSKRGENGPDEFRQLGRAVRDVAGSFSFTTEGRLDGQMWLVPKDGAAAQDVADVAKGALAAAKQKTSDNPEWSSALDQVTIRPQESRVDVSFVLSPSLLEQLMEKEDA